MRSSETDRHRGDGLPLIASRAASRRPASIALTAFGLALIGIATLSGRDSSESRAAWCVICAPSGSRVGVDLVLNVLLFIPFGAGLRAMRIGWGRALAAVAVTSLLVEILQMGVVAGRYASIADVATNAFGGGLGIMLAHRWRGLILPARFDARRLALAALAVWLALIGGSAVAALPSLPHEAYHVLWRPSGERSVQSEGTIVAARADGVPLLANRRPTDDPTLDGLRLGEPTMLEVTLVPSGEGGGDVRLEIRTEDRTPRVVLGQNGTDLLMRVHLRASDARLRGPTLRLPGALVLTSRTATDTVTVKGEISPRLLRVTSTVGGHAMERELRLGAHLGWSFLLPGRLSLPPLGRALADALWLGFLLVPAAYWARRSLSERDPVARRREQRATLVRGAFALVLGLAALPFALGVGPVPATAWPVAAGCALTGWAVGAAASNRARARGSR